MDFTGTNRIKSVNQPEASVGSSGANGPDERMGGFAASLWRDTNQDERDGWDTPALANDVHQVTLEVRYPR